MKIAETKVQHNIWVLLPWPSVTASKVRENEREIQNPMSMWYEKLELRLTPSDGMEEFERGV